MRGSQIWCWHILARQPMVSDQVDITTTLDRLQKNDNIDSLWTTYEELKQDQAVILREEAEILEDWKAEVQCLKMLLDSKLTPEGHEKWSRLAALDKKHDIVEEKRQGYQAKRLKYDTDVKEFSIEEYMTIGERVLE